MVEDPTVGRDTEDTSPRGPLGWCGAGLCLGGAALAFAPEVPWWAALSAAGTGLLMVAAGRRRMRARPRRRSLPPAAAGLVLALVAGFGVRALTLSLMVDHTVAATVPGTAPPVPARAAEVAWSWTPPGDGAVVDVLPGTLGPVVVLDDGVVALDGATGGELWRYRLRGADARASVHGGGTRVHVAHGDPDDPGRTGALAWVELDTARGATVEAFTTPPPPDGADARVLAAGPGTLVYSWQEGDGPPRISARDTSGFREEWSFTVPERPGRVCGPRREWDADNTLRTPDVFLVAYACAPRDSPSVASPTGPADTPATHLTGVVTALDPRNGGERWTRELPGLGDFPALRTGGPAADPEARPAVVAGPLAGGSAPAALDPRDGSHAVRITGESWTDGRSVLVGADTSGAVVAETAADRVLFHRVDPAGEIVETAALPGDEVSEHGPGPAVGLPGAVAVPSGGGRAGAGEGSGAPALWSVPFDGDPRLLVLDPPGGARPEPPGPDAGDHRAVAVPGALVTVVRGADTVRLYGLVA
ncbi:PQQ-like beta-propeller repeat protein [Nocardiopsis changdeensis]|uniref:Pyrrolo-quinoline quinone n=1 Tax=Nocardiopsis changdeensis TaxID=2831969 RepID=A0ABX8BI96_9ACTN|nr:MULTISPECIES: PQQ-like beta-propeller repeat protein [Nocardiopsis]QUX21123.1 hypothetical protein KGD84_22105 [Nocardiopsis changdeensis]QYX37052.1 PQQ-like beta-propeller repeat protein [Nocardiopsis sp. MT53]